MKTWSSRNGYASLSVGILVGLIVPGATARATDFVRGDVNDDGQVTWADVHALTSYLFRWGDLGSPPSIACGDAADANNDGMADLADSAVLIYHLALGNSQFLAAPFPEPGADDAFEAMTDGTIPCASTGTVAPIEDPVSDLRVLDALAAGGTDRQAVVRFALSSSGRVAGYRLTLDSAGTLAARDALGESPSASPSGFYDLTAAFAGGVKVYRTDSFRVTAHFLSSLIGNVAIPAGTERLALELHLCLEPGTPAGEYPLTLVQGELVDYESARPIVPRLVHGTLTVAEDVTGTTCSLGPAPSVEPAVTFELGEATGPPGGEVRIPLLVHAGEAIRADEIGYSIDFDEETLYLASVEPVFPRPDGEPWRRHWRTIDNERAISGSGGVDEGYAAGIATYGDTFPIDEEFTALELRFLIREGVPDQDTEIRFENGGAACHTPPAPHEKFCWPQDNHLMAAGAPILNGIAGAYVTVAGRVSIVGEVTVFVRGDSNGDRELDISDAVHTLDFLFLGGEAPCLDAADANDDGNVDVSDPVATLGSLFLGTGPLPPPIGLAGKDPTADELGCTAEGD